MCRFPYRAKFDLATPPPNFSERDIDRSERFWIPKKHKLEHFIGNYQGAGFRVRSLMPLPTDKPTANAGLPTANVFEPSPDGPTTLLVTLGTAQLLTDTRVRQQDRRMMHRPIHPHFSLYLRHQKDQPTDQPTGPDRLDRRICQKKSHQPLLLSDKR